MISQHFTTLDDRSCPYPDSITAPQRRSLSPAVPTFEYASRFQRIEFQTETLPADGVCLGLQSRRTNAPNVRFLADRVCLAPNGRHWASSTYALNPEGVQAAVTLSGGLFIF